MKLFRMKPKPENDEEDRELVLDTDSAEGDIAQDAPEEPAEPALAPETSPAVQPDIMPSDSGDPLLQLPSEATEEMAAEEKPAPADPASQQPQETLDPDLLDIFREAEKDVQETTLASELPDIPIQDLLSDLVSVSRELGIAPRARTVHKSGPELREGGK